MSQRLERHLYIPDVHRPYHDKRAWALVMQVARAFKPQTIVTLGDFGDFYSVSAHSKAPNRDRKLKWEVASVNEGLDELDALGAKRKIFLGGNHCLTPDHRVLTQHGWKHWTELTIGQPVATRRDDGTLEWQPVQRILSRFTAPGEAMFDHSQRGFSACVTEHHNIVGHSNGTVWRRKAADAPDTFDVMTGVLTNNNEYPLSDAQLKVAAWACTDVHYASLHTGVTFYQSEGKHQLLQHDLDALKLPYRLTKRTRDIQSICGKRLKAPAKPSYEFRTSAAVGRDIRALTGLDRKGMLPPWVMALSDRQFNVFLDVLITADGSRVRNASACVFNGQRQICEALMAAACVHGWRASLSEYRPGQFRVNLAPYLKLRVQGWKRSRVVRAPEHVFCLTVPNGNFIVERQGKIHVTGNCDRLRRYLQDKAPELFDVVDIPSLLRLKERKWEYVPYKEHTKIGRVYFTHDVGSAGRYAAFKALDMYRHGVVTGHTHKMAYIVEGNLAGEQQLSCILGWLGDPNQVDYEQRGKVIRDSAPGFGVGYFDPSTNYLYIVPVPLIKHTCVVEGKLYRA